MRPMKYVMYGLMALVHFALMSTLLPLLLPPFIAVDFAIICVVCIAVFAKDDTAGLFGLSIGLLLDLFTAPALGLYMLFYGLLGAVLARLFDKTKMDNIIVVLGAILAAYLLRDVYLFVFQIAHSRTLFPMAMFLKFSFLSALTTTSIGLIWYFWLGKLHQMRSLRARVEPDFHLYDYDQS